MVRVNLPIIMETQKDIISYLNKNGIIYNEARHTQRALLLSVDTINRSRTKKLLDLGVTEFTAVSDRGVIKICITF